MSPQLLVTVDSLRFDHFDAMPRTRAFLDAEHDDAYATFPATLGSFPAIVGGEYATTSGLPAGTSVVPHLPGYRVGITTNHLLSAGYGYDDGFDRFEAPSAGGEGLRERLSAKLDMGSTAYTVASAGWNALQRVRGAFVAPERTFRPAPDVIDAFLGAVAGREEWFGWLHFMEPHHPYEPDGGPVSRVKGQNLTRKALSGRVSAAEADTVRALYRREVEELDAALEPLWEGLPGDAEVVFCADHGELLGEDDIWGHPGVLREALLHVPFGTRNVDAALPDVLSLIDVPTLLRGEPHGEGDLTREVAYALYGEQRAAIDGEHVVTDRDPDPVDAALARRLDDFDVGDSPTREDALDRDLEALGYR